MSSELAACTIQLSNVSYTVNSVPILKTLSLDCTERRIGIVGRNGSGKSTLARVLCGLLPPSTGFVKVADVDVTNDRAGALRTVGILFQNPDHQIIFPTVIEEVSFGLEQLGLPKAEAQERSLRLLAEFKCDAWADRSVSTLSQGQRHLVCLLSVVAMKPRVIVLDEPYAGLDIPTTMQLGKYINALDAVVVHISHQAEVLSTYQRVLWLENGEVRMDGAAEHTLNTYVSSMKDIGDRDALV